MSAPDFGFHAEYEPACYDGDNAGWKVTLPHQCDGWTITAPSYYDPPVPHAEAVAELSRFVAEAQRLLAVLRDTPTEPEKEVSLTAADWVRPDDEPNWEPLRKVLLPYECDPWMWMSRSEHDGRTIESYKHRETRGYLHLDGDGQAWTWDVATQGCYSSFVCDLDHEHTDDTYTGRQIPLTEALERALS